MEELEKTPGAAEGETLVRDEGHITRGYEDFDRCLCSLGADLVLEHKGEDYGIFPENAEPHG